MTTKMTKMEAAIAAYKSLNNPIFSGRSVRGVLSGNNYEELSGRLAEHNLSYQWDAASQVFSFNLPSEDNCVFAKDMAELLSAYSRQITPPVEFYVADIGYHHKKSSPVTEPKIQAYFDTAKFLQELDKISDLQSSPSRRKITFLHGEKLEISTEYTVEDLACLTDSDTFYRDFVDSDIHKTQKSSIIKSVLIEMLKSNEIDRLTFPCLLKRFREFTDRVNSNYQLYVTEFSFEKIKSQVESEKLDFTLKINKVFSDIQNQLLAIPLALVLIGSQIEPETSITAKNTALFLGAVIFSLLMSLLLRNQTHSLKSIKVEITNQWKEMKEKHLFSSERLEPHYTDLRKRYRQQRLSLALVSMVVSLLTLASACYFIYSTESLYENTYIILKNGVIGGSIYVATCSIFRLKNIIQSRKKRKKVN